MKSLLKLFLLTAFPLIFSISAQAETKHGWPSITLTGGGYSFDDSSGLDQELLYGIKIGYEINGQSLRNRLGIEAIYQRVEGYSEDLDADVNVTVLRLDLLYLYNPIKKMLNMTPYFSVGAGGQFVDGDLGEEGEPLVAYGFGVKIPLTEALALRADARHLLIFADEQFDEFEYTIGLQYSFGKPKKVRPKKVVKIDSDKDGVFDDRDQCPDTPEGLKVNSTGCPVNPPDTDEDGVADYLDKCPETVQGYPVDKEGCLFDSDNDGVADPFDKCPNNPPGFKVNADGCM